MVLCASHRVPAKTAPPGRSPARTRCLASAHKAPWCPLLAARGDSLLDSLGSMGQRLCFLSFFLPKIFVEMLRTGVVFKNIVPGSITYWEKTL